MAASTPTNDTPSGDAALVLAEAAAATGTASAQLGYQLTTQALQASEAAAVFPLLMVELTAIAEGFAAYAATDADALAATDAAQAAAEAGAAYWSPAP
ncbi:MAG TPA: hypothetical protein VMI53_10325 [Opitutaceae bacterium]|nr:hypothetical protein [Opitutaceae bacterium]